MEYERRNTGVECYGLRLWWTTPEIEVEIARWESAEGAWCSFPAPHYEELDAHWTGLLRNKKPHPKEIAYKFWLRSDDLQEKYESLNTFCEWLEICMKKPHADS